MNTNWPLIAVFIIGITALIGYFVTKHDGFGRFNTSTLLLLIIVIISGIFYAVDKIETGPFLNIVFAIVGFAGGLFTAKEKTCSNDSGDKGNKPQR